uniref:Uncharacterized protein n=1 Tax=Eutreptiella gymnastica TaxID=73025 RepID=A0A7S1JA25_9EUGL|mmetsp:Transcript_78557/g.138801  ORF Transcript_78557/g.138801 Transcript_78557/m.138801 type:complete len:119 (+) Transcript_78557:412-768(+)
MLIYTGLQGKNAITEPNFTPTNKYNRANVTILATASAKTKAAGLYDSIDALHMSKDTLEAPKWRQHCFTTANLFSQDEYKGESWHAHVHPSSIRKFLEIEVYSLQGGHREIITKLLAA